MAKKTAAVTPTPAAIAVTVAEVASLPPLPPLPAARPYPRLGAGSVRAAAARAASARGAPAALAALLAPLSPRGRPSATAAAKRKKAAAKAAAAAALGGRAEASRAALRRLRSELLDVEEAVPWSAVTAGWRSRRPAWRRTLRSSDAAACVARALREFRCALAPARGRAGGGDTPRLLPTTGDARWLATVDAVADGDAPGAMLHPLWAELRDGVAAWVGAAPRGRAGTSAAVARAAAAADAQALAPPPPPPPLLLVPRRAVSSYGAPSSGGGATVPGVGRPSPPPLSPRAGLAGGLALSARWVLSTAPSLTAEDEVGAFLLGGGGGGGLVDFEGAVDGGLLPAAAATDDDALLADALLCGGGDGGGLLGCASDAADALLATPQPATRASPSALLAPLTPGDDGDIVAVDGLDGDETDLEG